MSVMTRAPTRKTLRRLVLRQIQAAGRAASRLRDAEHPRALHDFRVAARRLRTILRAYRKPLASPHLSALSRRLKALARETNPARDAEAQLACLRALGAGPEGSTSSRGLEGRLRAHAAQGRRALSARIPRALDPIAEDMARALKNAPCLNSASVRKTHRRQLERRLSHLDELLERIHSRADRRALHKARIETKRLRYLIEPFQRRGKSEPRLTRRLKNLQSLLGELRDTEGLSSYVRRSQTPRADARLRAALRDRARKLFRKLLNMGGWNYKNQVR